MPVRHGQAFWPGVRSFISCSYTCSQGISPGIATLEIPEQDTREIATFGDLVITDGVGTITLRRCRLQNVDFTREGGRRIILHIADRRWMWRYGYVTGSWNVIDPFPDPNLFPDGVFVQAGGPYTPGTYRPAHLLMGDCLSAMGETNLPLINPAPAIPIQAAWDYDNPAAALSSLADAVNFRVCFQVGTDRVLVAPQGTGLALPDSLPIISESPAVSLPTRPSVIQLVGGECIFNDLLALEPVGLEPSGEVKPIDQLSFTPPGGWGRAVSTTFATAVATNELTQEAAVEQAKRCIWRMFRVKMIDVTTGLGPGPNVAGYGLVRDRKQIELLPNQYGTSKQANGQPDTSPPYVLGSIYTPRISSAMRFQGGAAGFLGNSDPTSGVRLPVSPQIDGARGLVVFDRQCFRAVGALGVVAQLAAPELYLYTGFRIRDVIGRKPVKFLRGGATDTANLGCPPEILRHPELVLTYRGIRANVDRTLRATDSNLEDILPAANYYLEQANARYNTSGAMSRTYAGIHSIDCDGAIQQVSWRVGGGAPATTTASLNSEHDPYTPPYPERRRNEQTIAFNSKPAGGGAGGGGDFGGYVSQHPPPNPPPGK